MTPSEFKAVEKGYQLHLLDEQDQALVKAQIPQEVFGVDTEAVRPSEFTDEMHEKNQKLRDRITGNEKIINSQFKAGSLSPAYKKIMEERARKEGEHDSSC